VIKLSYSLIFPGQGSQFAGMGKGLSEEFDSASKVFEKADEALGFSLSNIIFEGPEEVLKKTEYTQPAILAASIAVFEVLKDLLQEAPSPEFMAGHSLGEYTALVASGALTLEDGIKLVHLRGRLMQEAVPEGEGTMAAVLGLSRKEVEEICKMASGDQYCCQPANYNSPAQIVISGHTQAVSKAVTLSKGRGAKRAVPLKVSAPFHSKLMVSVADKLRKAALECRWNEPSVPIVANVSARPVRQIDEIIDALTEQTHNPVLWSDSVHYMHEQGCTTFYELGPGKVLTGLVKKCEKNSSALSAMEKIDIEKIRGHMSGSDQ